MSSEAQLTTIANAPVQPPKKRRWLKIVLGILAVFVVIIAVAVGVAFWATSGLVDTIDRQLAAIKKGDYQAAYNETSLGLRDKFSLAAFEAYVKRYPVLVNNKSHSFSNRSFKDSVGRVEGTLTDTRGQVMPVQYQLVKENDAWRITYIHIGAKPELSGDKKK
jgi:hypothetical protein